MPRQSKAQKAERNGQKKLVFPKRITIRLDDDVHALMTASVESGVEWASQAHASNAGLRRAFQKFASPNVTVRIDPFEQLVFAKKLRRK
jgi:hypothetical protein